MLSEVANLPGSSYKARVLRVLFEHAPAELLASALDTAFGLTQSFAYAELICSIAPRLPRDLAVAPLTRALDAIQEIGDGEYRGELLCRVAPHLPEALLPRAMDITEGIDEDFVRANALRAFVPRAQDVFRDGLLRAVRGLADRHNQAVLLAELAADAAGSPQTALLEEALARVREIDCALHRAEALREVALRPVATTPGVLEAALVAALAEGRDYYAVKLILDLGPRLPKTLLEKGLAAIADLRDEELRSRGLAELAAFLPPELHEDALSIAETISSDLFRGQALVGMSPTLPEGLLDRALGLGLGLRAAWRRVEVIAALTPSLPAPLLGRALSKIRGIQSESMRLEALRQVMPHLPEGLLEETLAAADGFSDGPYAALLLLHLAAVSPEPLARRALDRLRTLPERALRVDATEDRPQVGRSPEESTLDSAPGPVEPPESDAPTREEISEAIQLAIETPELPMRAPRPVRSDATPGAGLAVIDRLESEAERLIALRELALTIPAGSQLNALAVVKGFRNPRLNLEALKLVLPRLAGKALAEAVEIAGASSKSRDLDLIAAIAPEICRLDGEGRYDILRGLLQTGNGETRPELLRALAAFGPVITASGGVDAAELTALAVRDVGTWWP